MHLGSSTGGAQYRCQILGPIRGIRKRVTLVYYLVDLSPEQPPEETWARGSALKKALVNRNRALISSHLPLPQECERLMRDARARAV